MSRGHGDKLTAKQELAIAALLSEATVEQAATKAGIGYRTLKDWLRRPDFSAAYGAARRDVLRQAVKLLGQLTQSAVLALGKNLKCGKPGVENRAAELILQHAFKGEELLELAREVEQLRQRLEEVEHGRAADAGEADGGRAPGADDDAGPDPGGSPA
jgi:hypothetical protein